MVSHGDEVQHDCITNYSLSSIGMVLMKAGDLIHMPGQTLLPGETVPSVGVVIDDDPPSIVSSNRIGVMWADNWGNVDYEPRDWLEVVSEAIPVEA